MSSFIKVDLEGTKTVDGFRFEVSNTLTFHIAYEDKVQLETFIKLVFKQMRTMKEMFIVTISYFDDLGDFQYEGSGVLRVVKDYMTEEFEIRPYDRYFNAYEISHVVDEKECKNLIRQAIRNLL